MSLHRRKALKSRALLFFSLFMLCLGFQQILSHHIDPQASMDAQYYSIIAQRYSQGLGLTEPFIWQHLKAYPEIVRPIDYWQPLGILIYGSILMLFPPAANILLNHAIWAFLAVLVFRDTFRISGNTYTSLLAYLFFAIGGKYSFYLSTTDNIAFYALFGYFFFNGLLQGTSLKSACQCGFTGGLLALTRVEGLFFGVLALPVFLKRRRFLEGILLLLALLLAVLPWTIRNHAAFGVLWNRSDKALFLETYNDMFEPGFPGTPENYFSHGLPWIAAKKLEALRRNIMEFFLIPSFLLFLPFWIMGFYTRWHEGGKILSAYLVFFWLLNSLVFTVQSLRGTAFHNCAAFIPHVSIMAALGAARWLSAVVKNPSPLGNKILFSLLVVWMLGFTAAGVLTSGAGYALEKDDYRRFFQKIPLPPSEAVASDFPILVHSLTGCPGVGLSEKFPEKGVELAARFNCRYILYDSRYHSCPLPDLAGSGWKLVASASPLTLWERGKIDGK